MKYNSEAINIFEIWMYGYVIFELCDVAKGLIRNYYFQNINNFVKYIYKIYI